MHTQLIRSMPVHYGSEHYSWRYIYFCKHTDSLLRMYMLHIKSTSNCMDNSFYFHNITIFCFKPNTTRTECRERLDLSIRSLSYPLKVGVSYNTNLISWETNNFTRWQFHDLNIMNIHTTHDNISVQRRIGKIKGTAYNSITLETGRTNSGNTTSKH